MVVTDWVRLGDRAKLYPPSGLLQTQKQVDHENFTALAWASHTLTKSKCFAGGNWV
jgi:hypothetical protein